ncbi:acyltransferase-like protein At1g54570, chloroplastic isoform X2 [Manihot esculenta]|uniref:acyltransferase-like protein At1g54570, chloroplastic isoform X2 n=1 Tax=Manihot esculenta TaxID=3983 RepID=UPI001CC6FB83|nr:acyltransferase-like protein At1g54570, chloroplastic isoform X2 [Manihot esculenta]
MASVFSFQLSPYFLTNSVIKGQFRVRVQNVGSRESKVLSSDSIAVNKTSFIDQKKKNGVLYDGGTLVEEERALINGENGRLGSVAQNKRMKDVSKDLEALWDDGYGTKTVKDYLDVAKEMIRPDGGPPRWFCPLECGQPRKNSPTLLFLPGMDGVGLGLILHHEALGKAFEVWCLHIPVYDRTPFEGLLKFVEETVRTKHAASPNRPIYLVGDSFGGCLALAVAARNPKIDLVLILANPATSFDRSQLQPLLPILEALPDGLHNTVPYLFSLFMGDPLKMATIGIENRLPPKSKIKKLFGNLTAFLPLLSGLADIIPTETLLWKLKLLNSAAAYANSCLHAIKAEVLVLARLFRAPPAGAMFSTLDDGRIVRGLVGVPKEGPVLFVGYHMLMGFELFPLVEEFLREKIVVRGLAHPVIFTDPLECLTSEFSVQDLQKVLGAVPVTASNIFRLLSTKSHVLLYPGGAREALHYKGEEHKLCWPKRQEFVRMAARFGAAIVPFGTVGEDDIAELVLDYNDLMQIPFVNDFLREINRNDMKLRDESEGEVANQELFIPGLLPKVPGRFYFLFGKPIETKGKEELLKDRDYANELYLQVKSEVEHIMDYLLKKREEDPYRSIIDRTLYHAIYHPWQDVPAFDP